MIRRWGIAAAWAAATVAMTTGMEARADAFAVTYEAPGVTNANTGVLCSTLGSGACTIGVETFDERRAGTQSFVTDFGTGGVITGSYNNVDVVKADQYGGAADTGKYAVTFATSGYSLSLSSTLATGVNYFGFWLSALDAGNTVSFYRDNQSVYTFTPADVTARIGGCTAGANPYCGNPVTHEDGGETFVFLNFFDTTNSFDRIVFSETPQVGGYESDNQTVGFTTAITGTPVPVPEPASEALLGGSIVALGIVCRRRSRAAAR